MTTVFWMLLGAAIGVLAPVLLLRLRSTAGDSPPVAVAPARPKPRATPEKPAPRAQSPRKFHGVSVRPGPLACPAVQALDGQRFLPDDAPALPLRNCDQDRCRCSYSHHGDRRDAEDRRSGWGTFGGFAPTVAGGNRRARKRDRRDRS